MKHLLPTTIAAVVLVGCGPSEAELTLIHSARIGDIEAVKQSLADGADVDATNVLGGTTPLLWAVRGGHTEIAELLIAKGADDSSRSCPCVSWKCGCVGQCSSKPEPSVS